MLHFKEEPDQTQSVRKHKHLFKKKKNLEHLTLRERFGMMSKKKFQGTWLMIFNCVKRNIK